MDFTKHFKDFKTLDIQAIKTYGKVLAAEIIHDGKYMIFSTVNPNTISVLEFSFQGIILLLKIFLKIFFLI